MATYSPLVTLSTNDGRRRPGRRSRDEHDSDYDSDMWDGTGSRRASCSSRPMTWGTRRDERGERLACLDCARPNFQFVVGSSESPRSSWTLGHGTRLAPCSSRPMTLGRDETSTLVSSLHWTGWDPWFLPAGVGSPDSPETRAMPHANHADPNRNADGGVLTPVSLLTGRFQPHANGARPNRRADGGVLPSIISPLAALSTIRANDGDPPEHWRMCPPTTPVHFHIVRFRVSNPPPMRLPPASTPT